MKVLLDTHAFLWFINDSPQLSETVVDLLTSDVDALLSVGSLWEMAIKVSIGKLELPGRFEPFISEQLAVNDIDLLPIAMNHMAILTALPLHHRDPFDRLIVAQAIVEYASRQYRCRFRRLQRHSHLVISPRTFLMLNCWSN